MVATGPSLTPDVAEDCCGYRTIAVNDAWRLLPWADVLYAADEDWWNIHEGCPEFTGEKWSHVRGDDDHNKIKCAADWDINLIVGAYRDGFSTKDGLIHYGSNSGFQAINLAMQFGATRIVLVGFDMQPVDGKRHFFGDHPAPLRNGTPYTKFIPHFEKAAKLLPAGIEIINATPGSALTCFKRMALNEALSAAA